MPLAGAHDDLEIVLGTFGEGSRFRRKAELLPTDSNDRRMAARSRLAEQLEVVRSISSTVSSTVEGVPGVSWHFACRFPAMTKCREQCLRPVDDEGRVVPSRSS
jgi:hypothetical protein